MKTIHPTMRNPDALSPADCDELIASLLKSGMSPKDISRAVNAVRIVRAEAERQIRIG